MRQFLVNFGHVFLTKISNLSVICVKTAMAIPYVINEQKQKEEALISISQFSSYCYKSGAIYLKNGRLLNRKILNSSLLRNNNSENLAQSSWLDRVGIELVNTGTSTSFCGLAYQSLWAE